MSYLSLFVGLLFTSCVIVTALLWPHLFDWYLTAVMMLMTLLNLSSQNIFYFVLLCTLGSLWATVSVLTDIWISRSDAAVAAADKKHS